MSRAGQIKESKKVSPKQVGKTFESEVLSYLRTIQIFSELPEQELIKLSEACRFSEVASGEYIAIEGDDEICGFIVVSGRLSMMKTSLSGKEFVVELLPPGDIFGLLMAMQKLPERLSARAQCKSRVLWIPVANLTEVLTIIPALYKLFATELLECLQASYCIARGLAHDQVEVRIAAILTHLAIKFSRNLPVPHNHIIDITRQQIADLTGTTPETAIRVTRSMQKKGLIEMKTPGAIEIIKLAALQHIAEL